MLDYLISYGIMFTERGEQYEFYIKSNFCNS